MTKGIGNKRYTPEFKKIVVETMREEGLSYKETRLRFEIAGEDRVRNWDESTWRKVRKDWLLSGEDARSLAAHASFPNRPKKISLQKISGCVQR